MQIPFNKPYMTGKELWYIAQAHALGNLAGDGSFTKKCNGWLEQRTGTHKALLTHSCTAALEMAAILADLQPGDEVIMRSYTFVSTANAFGYVFNLAMLLMRVNHCGCLHQWIQRTMIYILVGLLFLLLRG